jgi:putative flippase GtrA
MAGRNLFPLLRQFFSFAAVGAIGTLFHYAVLVGSVSGLRFDPVVGSMFGFVVGAGVNYVGNYYVTFKSKKSHLTSSIKFLLIALVGFCINWMFMCVLPLLFGFYYLYNQCIATLIVLFWNFSGNKIWTFRDTETV